MPFCRPSAFLLHPLTRTSRDLTPLAKAGVLWLNTSLTVRAHKAGSHSGHGWETFTAAVLRVVTARADGRGVVFFVWGKPAEKMCKSLGIDEVRAPFFSRRTCDNCSQRSRPVEEASGAEVSGPRSGVITALSRRLIIFVRSAHPSPLSANRGFIGNGHFKRANEWLRDTHGAGAEIDWAVLSP